MPNQELHRKEECRNVARPAHAMRHANATLDFGEKLRGAEQAKLVEGWHGPLMPSCTTVPKYETMDN